MDIATAENALAALIAQSSGLELDREVLCGGGDLPPAAPLVQIFFVSGKLSATTLTELVAEVRGSFAEPEEARSFAAAVWGALPQYGVSNFTELAADDKGEVEFAERDGFFTATGRVKAYFA